MFLEVYLKKNNKKLMNTSGTLDRDVISYTKEEKVCESKTLLSAEV